MTALNILDFEPVNFVDPEKVNNIYKSILENGWSGAPILVYGNCLITGSHRKAALIKLFDDGYNLNFECAEDVTDIIEGKIAEGMEESEIFNNLDYLREIFTGTWVEEYKDDLVEW